MRFLAIIAVSLFLLGCVSDEEEANVTENLTINESVPINDTNITNQTIPEPSEWERYSTEQFSFDYPVNMDTQEATGIFSGDHVLDGETGEILVVMYYNTSKVYGVNKDKEFKQNPSQAATDLLEGDMQEGPIHMLDSAEEIEEIIEFSIVRDVYVSQASFRIRFSETGPAYTGYALSLYIPERSMHIKMRVIALNSQIAEDIKDQFLLSFRLE